MRKVRPSSILSFKSGKFTKNYCRLIFWKNLKKKETLCLSRKALIGSHPSSASRAHDGRFILVRIVILAAWYWRLSKKTILSSHVLPWGVVLNSIRHYQIQFDWNYCFPKFLIIPFNLLSILSFIWLPICEVGLREREKYTQGICNHFVFNICILMYPFIRFTNAFFYVPFRSK